MSDLQYALLSIYLAIGLGLTFLGAHIGDNEKSTLPAMIVVTLLWPLLMLLGIMDHYGLFDDEE